MDLNTLPPFFGQTQPIYPPLLQLVRVVAASGGSVANLYNGFTQQVRTDNLQTRDRESCLVLDIQQGGLVPGYYLARLVRSADATFPAPVYAVADCCGSQGGGGGSNITVVNDCTLTKSPGFSKGLVINLCDNTLNFWTGLFWITWCNCFVGGSSGFVLPSSSSSSGGKCVPGVCSICINPPAVWNLPISGMTGVLAPLNGNWVLIPLDNCRWAATKTVNGNLYYASLVIGTDVVSLGFLNLTTGATLAVYNGPGILGGDCCQKALTLVLSPGFGGGGPTNNFCGACLPNLTPFTWTLILSGFTGIFSVFNGTWTVGPNTEQTGCAWEAQDANLNFVGVNAFGSAGLADLQVLLYVAANPLLGQMRYYQDANTMTDCCIQQTLKKDPASTVGVGDGPATIAVSPDCSSSGDTAPPNLTVTPTCCSTSGSSSSVAGGSSSSGGTVVTNCCPGGLPSVLYATFNNVSGASCLDGLKIPITFSVSTWTYSSAVSPCPGGTGFVANLACGGTGVSGFRFGFGCSTGVSPQPPTSGSCLLPLTWLNLAVPASCGGGTVNVTITAS